jgi:pimeloyl-ACP methyl ester carboxylesterase
MTVATSLPDLETDRREIATESGPISLLDIGEGEPVVFVHGVFASAYLWSRVLERLPAGRRYVAFDLPAHGRTVIDPNLDIDLGMCAALIGEVLDQLGLARAHLVANDSGGAIAQIYAAGHPDRLLSLTLTNCDTLDNLPPAEFADTVALARAGELAPALVQLLANPDLARSDLGLGRALEHPDQLTDDDIVSFLSPIAADEAVARQFERFIGSFDNEVLIAVDARLQELTVPTLIVWGTDDVFFSMACARQLADKIPGTTELIEIEGGRLFFPLERPDELVAALVRHWGRLIP